MPPLHKESFDPGKIDVEPTAFYGKTLVCRQAIERGELVFSELPLFDLPGAFPEYHQVKNPLERERQRHIGPTLSQVVKEVKKLDSDQRAIFNALSNSYRTMAELKNRIGLPGSVLGNGSISEADILEGGSIEDLDQETKEILGRWMTNMFWVSFNDLFGLWPTLARINHHCSPSASHQVDEHYGLLGVRATRKLEPGDEITVSYTDIVNEHFLRQASIEKAHNFRCRCSTCVKPQTKLSQSDRNRRRLAEFKELFRRWDMGPREGVSGKQVVAEGVALLKPGGVFDEEGLEGGGLRAHYWDLVYTVLISHQKLAESKRALERFIDEHIIACGPHAPELEALRGYLIDPTKSKSWGAQAHNPFDPSEVLDSILGSGNSQNVVPAVDSCSAGKSPIEIDKDQGNLQTTDAQTSNLKKKKNKKKKGKKKKAVAVTAIVVPSSGFTSPTVSICGRQVQEVHGVDKVFEDIDGVSSGSVTPTAPSPDPTIRAGSDNEAESGAAQKLSQEPIALAEIIVEDIRKKSHPSISGEAANASEVGPGPIKGKSKKKKSKGKKNPEKAVMTPLAQNVIPARSSTHEEAPESAAIVHTVTHEATTKDEAIYKLSATPATVTAGVSISNAMILADDIAEKKKRMLEAVFTGPLALGDSDSKELPASLPPPMSPPTASCPPYIKAPISLTEPSSSDKTAIENAPLSSLQSVSSPTASHLPDEAFADADEPALAAEDRFEDAPEEEVADRQAHQIKSSRNAVPKCTQDPPPALIKNALPKTAAHDALHQMMGGTRVTSSDDPTFGGKFFVSHDVFEATPLVKLSPIVTSPTQTGQSSLPTPPTSPSRDRVTRSASLKSQQGAAPTAEKPESIPGPTEAPTLAPDAATSASPAQADPSTSTRAVPAPVAMITHMPTDTVKTWRQKAHPLANSVVPEDQEDEATLEADFESIPTILVVPESPQSDTGDLSTLPAPVPKNEQIHLTPTEALSSGDAKEDEGRESNGWWQSGQNRGARTSSTVRMDPVVKADLAKIESKVWTLPPIVKRIVILGLDKAKHGDPTIPLSCTWTMSFLDGRSVGSGGNSAYDELSERNHILFTASTVPDFCGAFKSLARHLTIARGFGSSAAPRPSVEALKPSTSLCLFRQGIEPKWEHEANIGGGRLVCTASLAKLALVFDRVALLLVGDTLSTLIRRLPPGTVGRAGNVGYAKGVVVGIVANRRAKDDRLELWLVSGISATERGKRVPMEWIRALKVVLARELEMPEHEFNWRPHKK